MKERLENNFNALNKLVYPLYFEMGKRSFKVTGKKLVKIKACIEKLMSEGKMDKGRVIQHDNYVEYSLR